MSDQNGQPHTPDPRIWERAAQPAPSGSSPAPSVPAQVPSAPEQVAQPIPVAQLFQADRTWVDGYEPGNPWQARLCMETPYGTFVHPLTPNTIPDLLEPLVLVAQEQQGMPVGFESDEDSGPVGEDVDDVADEQHWSRRVQGGRAARLSGWSAVHNLWQREDPTARIVMGAIVVVVLLIGILVS
ncbi:hypothetical protein [Streptomyces griseiscabiei]|uniref:Integral membrane protein n=1 Tax=Streptomyces griseiscabiei TaxID=2993540 RepID=A0ABU4L8X5_9ACTN|nr:hypothetical protein [Streptomyces griseiscabiei]MBZ3907013.1 hypothetical protein [Streptomyces griseiscabiei]MDX2911604.1 hypothetical protein [Streptomyces griseiscabiei]